jgi:hypothetical protein
MSVELAEQAAKLEKKGKYAKAADLYIKAEMPAKAAKAYEQGCDYSKAELLYEEAGDSANAQKMREKKRKTSAYDSFEDEQSKFQQEFGNPY